jgi:hypothetical protein
VKLRVLFSAALLLGCSGNAVVQQGPSDTLRAYAQALEQGRVDEAYRLLSDEAKRSMSLDAFRRAVKENPADVLEIARAISRPASDPVVSATVSLPNGDELVLIFEGGQWRLDAAAVDLYGQATPRQALAGFLRAFEHRRFDVIMRYVPDAEKQGVASLSGDALDEAAPPSPDAAPAKDVAPDAKDAKDAKDGKPPRAPAAERVELTPEKLKEAWEGPQKEQINRIVQAIKAALPTATIEETGDSAAMSYGAGGTVAFVREHGVWKIKDF